MCGIFGYTSTDGVTLKHLLQILITGIRRQEYRGYDSAGLAVSGTDIKVIKQVGNVSALEHRVRKTLNDKELDEIVFNRVGIAHTRWATHGPPSNVNSHPQCSGGKFAVVHNGVVVNYRQLKLELQHHTFESETDTEVIAKLFLDINEKTPGVRFPHLAQAVCERLDGSYAIIVTSTLYPGECVVARRGSPAIVGHCVNFGHANFFIASDIAALVEHTNDVVHLEDGDVAHMSNGVMAISNAGAKVERSTTRPNITVQQAQKAPYNHFMAKEIFEQPLTLEDTMRGRVGADRVRLGGISDYLDKISQGGRILMIACGSSYHVCVATKGLLEVNLKKPVTCEIASHFLERSPPVFKSDVCIFVSQSGETADTLNALQFCKRRGALLLGVCNTVGSSISRFTTAGVHLNAGPEIGVASTKAFTSQYVVLVMLATMFGQNGDMLSELKSLPTKVKRVLDNSTTIDRWAASLWTASNLLLVGRGHTYATCLEGALKIKEVTYIFTEGLHAGELKHGSLALVDDSANIIMFCLMDEYYEQSRTALEQIMARGNRPFIVATEGDTSLPKNLDCLYLPATNSHLQGLLAIIPMQLLAYKISVRRGIDVDKPRNLAKSVTVE